MRLFVGLDVSLAKTAICVVSEHGKNMSETEVASEPEALLRWFENWKTAASPPSALRPAPCRNGCTAQWPRRGWL